MKKLTTEEVISRLEEAKQQGKRADFSDMDLSGLDLSGLDFSFDNLTGANFTDADLTDANFTRNDCHPR